VAQAVGRAIRRLRTDMGLSQEDLAVKAGIDRTYPSLLERGMRQPTVSVLLGVAHALKTTSQYILDLAEEELGNGFDMEG